MDFSDLERELRAARPEARDDLVAGLAERLRGGGAARRPAGRLRLAFAAILTAGLAAVFAGFGGIDYAAAAAKKAAQVAQAVTAPAPASNGNGPAGGGSGQKVSICHRTRSDGNPYVLIEVAQSAVPAHREHDDPPDIIPAPPGGCPGGDDGDDSADDQYGQKVPVCHRTRSAKNPYVLIVIPQAAIPAHRRHDDPPDIIPAPPTGCPD